MFDKRLKKKKEELLLHRGLEIETKQKLWFVVIEFMNREPTSEDDLILRKAAISEYQELGSHCTIFFNIDCLIFVFPRLQSLAYSSILLPFA